MRVLLNRLHASFLALALLGVWGCSSTPPSTRFELGQDSSVTFNNGMPQSWKKGDQLLLDHASTALIEAPGKVPTLLVPQNSQTPIVVDLKSLPAEQAQPQTQMQAAPVAKAAPLESQADMNDILFEVNAIQVLSSKGKYSAALKKIAELEKKYPKLGLVPFLKASCLVLSGEKERAKFVLIRAVAEYPQNAAGKDLYEEVKKAEREKQ